jgi:hypothetical protein
MEAFKGDLKIGFVRDTFGLHTVVCPSGRLAGRPFQFDKMRLT